MKTKSSKKKKSSAAKPSVKKSAAKKRITKSSKLQTKHNDAPVDKLVGKSLPKIKLPSTTQPLFSIPSDLDSKWTILYFYPRDNTPGCTKQACTFRDHTKDFEKNGIQVFGVSADSLDSHEKFQSKFKLNFPLLSDPDKKLSEALGVYREKSLYGRKYMGINRDSFLVDPKGVIRKVWRKVDPIKSVGVILAAAMIEIKPAPLTVDL